MVHRLFGARNTVLALVVCALFQVPAYAIMYEMMLDQKEIAAAWGINPAFAKSEYTASENARIVLRSSSLPANVMWAGDVARFDIQIQNRTNKAIAGDAQVRVIQYGTRCPGEDVFEITFFKITEGKAVTQPVNVPANGYQNVSLLPSVPELNGGYVLVIDLPGQERLLVAPFIRTFKNVRPIAPFTFLTIDNCPGILASRINAAPNRVGMAFKEAKDFERYFESKSAMFEEYKKYGVCVSLEFGHETDMQGPLQPLGQARPFLNAKNEMIDMAFDICQIPAIDAEATRQTAIILKKYGYPRGPITSVKLWNEPWEGGSIAGWGADMLRYRDLFSAMARGAEEARKDGIKVLIGGCDSHSNTLDKMFGDGSDSLLKWLDFCSIHYENTAPPTLIKSWINRPAALGGRVQIWDTESWVGNSDDRIGAVIGLNRAMGLDRAVGIHHAVMYNRLYTTFKSDSVTGGEAAVSTFRIFSTTAAVAANTYLIGDRPFKEILFKNGLPWVLVFDGLPGANGKADPEDATVMVIGDMGPVFGVNSAFYREVRGQNEINHKEELRAKRALLPANDPQIAKIDSAIAASEPIRAKMVLAGSTGKFGSYDFYGNPVAVAADGSIEIPLDSRGFFLRGNGKKGSFDAMIKAVKASRIDGYEPLHIEVRDFTAPIDKNPSLTITLQNILNRPISGTLAVSIEGLTVSIPASISLKAFESKPVTVAVTSGKSNPANFYRLRMVYDAGKDGKSVHEEDVRVNVISKRTIAVDGKLDDWENAFAQTAIAPKKIRPSLTEEAWFPFKSFNKSEGNGIASGYLAYDKDNFYFAAKIADTSADTGMVRMENRDDDRYFYPETTYKVNKLGTGSSGFSARYSGTVTPKFSEQYTFATMSDDGVRLWINDSLIIDNWTDHGVVENTGSIMLTKDKPARIKLEYYQGGGDGIIKLEWFSKSVKRQLIPAAACAPLAVKKNGKNQARGLTAEYCTGKKLGVPVVTRIDTVINYTWTDKQVPDSAFRTIKETVTIDTLVWPKGVRRYSYRYWPELPSGSGHDNVQIAFNVVPAGADEWAEYPRGTFPKFTQYKDTDYEYALNPIAPVFGGGTEIWRLKVPGMVHKHFFPRQPKCPQEGPVKAGKMATARDGAMRIVEASIPWSEMPKVKAMLDKRATIKFSYRVNDNSGVWMELTRDRSVSKLNCSTFHCDWEPHWSNEVEFAFEK